MSAYLPGLMAAINTRLANDTGTGGLYATGANLITWHGWAVPEGQAMPFVSMAIVDAQPSDSFRTKTDIVLFQVATVVDLNSSNPEQRAADILERIDGNWEAVAYGTPPAYGLDRWQPTVTGWSPSIIERVRTSQTQNEDGALQFVSEFRVYISKQGV